MQREIEIMPSSGFYYEKYSGYLVEFSDDKFDWISSYYYGVLIIPPFDHPLHEPVLRHEVEHIYFYQFFNSTAIGDLIWKFLFHRFFLDGIEELIVAYKSQTMGIFFSTKGNIINASASFLWLFLIGISLLFKPNMFFMIIGILIGLAWFYWR